MSAAPMRQEGAVRILINDHQATRNAMTPELCAGLSAALIEAQAD